MACIKFLCAIIILNTVACSGKGGGSLSGSYFPPASPLIKHLSVPEAEEAVGSWAAFLRDNHGTAIELQIGSHSFSLRDFQKNIRGSLNGLITANSGESTNLTGFFVYDDNAIDLNDKLVELGLKGVGDIKSCDIVHCGVDDAGYYIQAVAVFTTNQQADEIISDLRGRNDVKIGSQSNVYISVDEVLDNNPDYFSRHNLIETLTLGKEYAGLAHANFGIMQISDGAGNNNEMISTSIESVIFGDETKNRTNNVKIDNNSMNFNGKTIGFVSNGSSGQRITGNATMIILGVGAERQESLTLQHDGWYTLTYSNCLIGSGSCVPAISGNAESYSLNNMSAGSVNTFYYGTSEYDLNVVGTANANGVGTDGKTISFVGAFGGKRMQ